MVGSNVCLSFRRVSGIHINDWVRRTGQEAIKLAEARSCEVLTKAVRVKCGKKNRGHDQRRSCATRSRGYKDGKMRHKKDTVKNEKPFIFE